MVNIQLAKNLRVGELIGISYNNRIVLGVFAGIGIANNIQYYSLYNALDRTDRKPVKSYINTNSKVDSRVVRVLPQELPNDEMNKYYEVVNKLKNHKIVDKDFEPMYSQYILPNE